MSYIDDSVTLTLKWEGAIPWMYLDTRANVTVGCGMLIRDAGAASNLAFLYQAGGIADSSDVAADFNRVSKMAPGQSFGFYHTASSPVLSREFILTSLRTRVLLDDGEMAQSFKGWPSFCDQAKLALLDMLFNLGGAGLFGKFPLLVGAVRSTDWASAANECHRRWISDERNEWTKNMFSLAVRAA